MLSCVVSGVERASPIPRTDDTQPSTRTARHDARPDQTQSGSRLSVHFRNTQIQVSQMRVRAICCPWR
jgi:hypothetical protein